MKKATVTVNYDEEKLNALRLFLSEKGLTMEAELEEYLDTLFRRHTPSAVQNYLSLKEGAPTQKPEKRARTMKVSESEERSVRV